MASLSQSRALAGCRVFTTVRPRRVAKLSNGGKVFMRRKDAYMIEVNVGEEEPEDIAIRRYMKAVMDSKVLDALRARKVKESKIEAYKRRLRERHEMRKAEFEWPTWEEVEGDDPSPKVFDEFFSLDPDGDFGLGMGEDDFLAVGGGMWGGYMDEKAGAWDQGGYMDQNTGGYINGQPGFQGGYIDQNQNGGYLPGAQGGYLPGAQGQGGFANNADYGQQQAAGYGDYSQQQAGGFATPDYSQQPPLGQPGYDAQGNFIYTAPQ